ncbi:MAG: corrinoid protein [bacterium]
MELADLRKAVVAGNIELTKSLTQSAIDQGINSETILKDALIAGMDEVGDLFKANEIYVPEVLLSAKSMQQAMQLLRPLLVREGVKPLGRIVIGTVQGDLHDIGKNLVAMMLEGAGFEVIDLGNDVPPEIFVEKAVESNASIVAMSALLTTTMYSMKETIDALKERNLDGRISTMVGGAPVTESFAKEIGATAYGEDAATAVEIARKLIGRK